MVVAAVGGGGKLFADLWLMASKYLSRPKERQMWDCLKEKLLEAVAVVVDAAAAAGLERG